jgi:2,4-dienoyl-CoA reductase-like NADH-dependent reductase (Old Yellow Enzyme family)
MSVPLFTDLPLRGVTMKNRIAVSPMCQYSSIDGYANDWTFQHLASRAVGGAALVFTEATAVTAEGRISPVDLGIWSDDHIEALQRCTRFIESQRAVPGIQLAHAGRKASTSPPWEGGRPVPIENGGWQSVAPSAIPFRDTDPVPRALTQDDISTVVSAFADATRRAIDAGFRVIELHSAHGYLLHQFLSPLSIHRKDQYGGSFDNRTRLVCDVVTAMRATMPDSMPLMVRLSATDWADGGWDADQSVELARVLQQKGVDLIDCSSGGLVPHVKIPISPGYQVPFAERIRRESGIHTGAVGLITQADQANSIIADGAADIVLIARELLRNPYWPLHAARQLHIDVAWPAQYERARF